MTFSSKAFACSGGPPLESLASIGMRTGQESPCIICIGKDIEFDMSLLKSKEVKNRRHHKRKASLSEQKTASRKGTHFFMEPAALAWGVFLGFQISDEAFRMVKVSLISVNPTKSLREAETSSASNCRKYWFRPADKEFVEGMRLEQHNVRSHQHIARDSDSVLEYLRCVGTIVIYWITKDHAGYYYSIINWA